MKSLISGLVLLAFLATPLALKAANVAEAKKLIDQNRIRAAAEVLKAATEKDDEDAKAWALLADVSLQIKDLETADKAAYNALDIDDENPEYWKLAGKVAFDRGVAAYAARQPGNQIKSWFAEAEAKFGRCLKMDEKDKEVRWWLAWAKEWQEYPKKARKYYDEQIEMFPAEPKGYVRLGAMLANEAIGTAVPAEAQKIRKEAIEVFERGLKKSGPDAELLYNLGLALEWAGKKDDGKARYLEAIDADPGYQNAWKRLNDLKVPGSVLLPLAKKQLGKHRNNGTAASWAGYFLCAERKYEEALAVLLPALKAHGEHYAAYWQAFSAASAMLRSRSSAPQAVEALKKVHEYYWYSGSAANNIALYYRDTVANYKESLAWYERAVDREPSSQDLLNDCALIYLFHTSQKKKALPIYLKVLALVDEQGQKPERGFWDALENLCKYYWEVERDPEKVIEYGTRRYQEVKGVKPYNTSGAAAHYKQLAQKELEKKGKKPGGK